MRRIAIIVAAFTATTAPQSLIALAPLLVGWVNQCRAWLQNRSAPPLLQTYYTLHKLFHKDVLLAHNASPGGAADLLAATLFLDRVAG